MATLSDKEFLTLCRLASLKLSPDEIIEKKEACEQLLTYVEQLQEVDISSVKASFQVDPDSESSFEEDIPKPSLSIETVLKNAPKSEENFFIVPKMLGEKE